MKSGRETGQRSSKAYISENQNRGDDSVKLIGVIHSPAGDIKIFKEGNDAIVERPSGRKTTMTIDQLYKTVVFDPVN